MSDNELVILNQILKTQHETTDSSLTASQYFELFVAELVLRDYGELSGDEIRSGIVAGGSDGGVDSIYLFVNGILVEEDTVLPDFKKTPAIDLIITQAKTEGSFGE
ncbi:MAG TPA: hypothetical protein VEC38_15595, partial [Candidatus Binataceae bacterium]|nr:hypothetical protein [Candidatus Binataceae bacterium]